MWNVFLSACWRIVSPSRRHLRLALSALLTVACTLATAAQAAPLPTTTTLTLSSSSVAWHTAVTLTASVTASSVASDSRVQSLSAMRRSLATGCEDAAIVGKAQLGGLGTAAPGTAQLKFIPAIGVHTYKAIFQATQPRPPAAPPAAKLDGDWPLSDHHSDQRVW